MNPIKKFGLALMLIYFGNNFSESWKGAEIIIFMIGSTLFTFGSKLEEFFLRSIK